MDTTMILGIAAIVLAIILLAFNKYNNPYGMKRNDLLLANAVIKNNVEELRKYLKKGGSPNAVDKKGMPVLIIAAYRRRESIAKVLIDNDADVNATIPKKRKEIGGGTALIAAAGNGSAGIVRKLISKGAGVNQADANSFTPLMAAAYNGDKRNVSKLLEHGANLNDQDVQGFTPLMYAANAGNAEAVELLLEKGADPDMKDRNGNSAYTYAEQQNHTNCIRRLKKAMAQRMDFPDSNQENKKK